MDRTEALGELILAAIKSATADLRANQATTIARLAEFEARAIVAERDHAATRERLAAVEARAPIPGPPGKDGAPGADGFTCDELRLSQDPNDDRIVTLGYVRGDTVKSLGSIRLGSLTYCGLFDLGRTYERGDLVTLGGCMWHCNADRTTSRPGPGNASGDWTLAVKAGRDGRDAPRNEAEARARAEARG